MDPEFLNHRPEQDLAAALHDGALETGYASVFPVPAGLLDQLTPFYLVIDPWLRIVLAGRSMRTLVPEIAGYETGEPLALPMLFDAQSPARPFSFETLVANQRTLVIWVLRHRGIRIRGEVAALRIGRRDYLFFNGSPWLSSTRELDHFGLRLRDFAAYDPVVEHLMLLDTHRLIESDLRDVNRNLQEQRQLLERSNREVQAYLAVLAHEVRTPIAGVIGALELLGRTPLNRHQQELRRSVQDASNSLLELLNHILDYSSIGSSGIELRTYQTALASFCENVLIAMGSAALAARVDLFLVCPLDLPDVIVDPVRLRQVLLNLLGNAIKYRRDQTGAGSWVELRVALSAAGALDADAPSASDLDAGIDICFSIIDNGSGIDPAFMPILFEPFTREAPQGGGLRPPGTGLGLPICRELVQAMGGTISVESTRGVGSRFDVRLRVARAPARTGTPAVMATPTERACIVSDDGHFRTVFTDLLGVIGVQVVPESGDSGVLEIMDRRGVGAGRLQVGARRSQRSARTLVVVGEHNGTRAVGPGQNLLRGPVYSPRALREALYGGPIESQQNPRLIDPAGPAAVDPLRPPASVRVLVVEDNPVNLLVIRQQMQSLGYTIDAAVDGEEALACCTSRTYDLILSDLQMPRLDGYGLARELRLRDARSGRHTVLVAISADYAEQARRDSEAAGFDDYLVKPILLDHLRHLLSVWVPQFERPEGGSAAATLVAALDPPVDADALADALGTRDETVLRNLYAEFAAAGAAAVGDMQRELDAGRLTQLAAAAHRLKSSARLVGAEALADLSATLEHAAAVGSVVDVHADAPRLYAELERVLGWIRARTTQSAARGDAQDASGTRAEP